MSPIVCVKPKLAILEADLAALELKITFEGVLVNFASCYGFAVSQLPIGILNFVCSLSVNAK